MWWVAVAVLDVVGERDAEERRVAAAAEHVHDRLEQLGEGVGPRRHGATLVGGSRLRNRVAPGRPPAPSGQPRAFEGGVGVQRWADPPRERGEHLGADELDGGLPRLAP